MARGLERSCRLLPVLAALPVAACGGASPSSGVNAMLRVSGGQFVEQRIELGDEAAPGPAVHTVNLNNSMLFPGAQDRAVNGTTAAGAVAIAVGLASDSGHWLVPVREIDTNAPGDLAFSLKLALSPNARPEQVDENGKGSLRLVVRAIDAAQLLGPASITALQLAETEPSGALVVTLDWDTESDLDLRVTFPDPLNPGAELELWSKITTGLPRPQPGENYGPDDVAPAGQLLRDSNAQCVIDGARREDAVWSGVPTPPPAGLYTVRVDAFSLCGQGVARWHVRAHDGNDTELGAARGQFGDSDTRFPHGAGAGLLAFTFKL